MVRTRNRAKSLFVYVTWVALRPLSPAQAKVVGDVKTRAELDAKLAEIRANTNNRGKNVLAIFEQAKRLVWVGKSLWMSMTDPFVTVHEARTRPAVKVHDALPRKMLQELKKNDPEARKYIDRVSQSGEAKFEVIAVADVPMGTKEHTKWARRLLARTAAMNTSDLAPFDLPAVELEPGNCVKSSLLAYLRTSRDKKAKGLAARIEREMPDGPCTPEDALAWMSRVGDAWVFDPAGQQLGFRAYAPWAREPKAPSPETCATCGKGFKSRSGLTQHRCPGVRVTCGTCRYEFRGAEAMLRHEQTCGVASRGDRAVKRLGLVVHDGHASPVTHLDRFRTLAVPDEQFILDSLPRRELKPRETAPEYRPAPAAKPYPGALFVDGVPLDPGTYECDDLVGAVRALLPRFVPAKIRAASGQLLQVVYAHSSGKAVALVPKWRSQSEPRNLLDEELDLYRQARNRLDPWLRSRAFRAEYGPDVDEVFSKFGKKARVFQDGDVYNPYALDVFQDGDLDYPECYALDVRKHYSHVLCELKSVPVLGPTDRFYRWTGELREETWYLVSVTPRTFAQKVYFGDKRESVCLGRYLTEDWLASAVDEVVAELQPTSVVPCGDIGKVVRSIYEDFPERVAKDAVNHALGVAGKITSRDSDDHLFTSFDEAAAHARDAGAAVHKLADDMWYTTRYKGGRYRDGWRWSLWVAHQEAAVFDMARRAHELRGMMPFAIKTDCLYFWQDEGAAVVDVGDAIGQFKPIECVSHSQAPSRYWVLSVRLATSFPETPGWNDVPDVSSASTVMLQARFPGSGKSYAWEELARGSSDRFLVVAAQHSTLMDVRQKLPGADVTLTTSVSWYREPVFNAKAKRKFDPKDFHVIVLEEAGLFPTSQLRKMALEMEKLAGLGCRVIVTMDANQLAPVGDQWYDAASAERLFIRAVRNRVWLKRNRTLAPKDHGRMHRLESRMKARDLPGMVREVRSWSAPVSYDDVKRGAVPGLRIGHTRALASLTSNALGLDDRLVYRGAGPGFVKNNTYRVDNGALVCELTGQRVEVERERIYRDFEHADSVTYYGSQGRRTSGQVLLMDIDSPLQSCEALWMAVFRARDFEKVRVVTGATDEVKRAFQVVKDKVNGYRDQDRRAGRDPKDNVTVQDAWELLKHARFRCWNCPTALDVLDGGAWCLDRQNVDGAHTKDNCKPSCTRCNLAKAPGERRLL